MIPPLDLFKIVRASEPEWLESAHDIESVKLRLGALGTGNYFVFSQRTGHKTFFKVDEHGNVADVTLDPAD